MLNCNIIDQDELAEEIGVKPNQLAAFNRAVLFLDIAATKLTDEKAMKLAPEQGVEAETIGDLKRSGKKVKFPLSEIHMIFRQSVDQVGEIIGNTHGDPKEALDFLEGLSEDSKRAIFVYNFNASRQIACPYLALEG